jgi:hypothetical protein
VDSWLAGFSVHVGSATGSYRMRRFSVRARLIVGFALSAGVIVVLVTVGAAGFGRMRNAVATMDAARVAQRDALQVKYLSSVRR